MNQVAVVIGVLIGWCCGCIFSYVFLRAMWLKGLRRIYPIEQQAQSCNMLSNLVGGAEAPERGPKQ